MGLFSKCDTEETASRFIWVAAHMHPSREKEALRNVANDV